VPGDSIEFSNQRVLKGEMVMGKNTRGILWVPATVLSALSAVTLCILPASAEQTAAQPQVLRNAVVNEAVKFDVSEPVGEMAQASAQAGVRVVVHPMLQPKLNKLKATAPEPSAVAHYPAPGPLISARIGLGFEGVGQVGGPLDCPSVSLQTLVPPDTNAAVGDTQVVEWVNTCYAVFNKSTGALIAGPFAGTNFWKGFGAPCETNNDGDIIIQWDKANHRWLASQNVFNGPPFYTCVAESRTTNAAGSYFRYAFPQQAGFPDYPKWGLTPGAYYQTQNLFDITTNAFLGVNVCAYQTSAMLKGFSNAEQVCIADNSNGTVFDDSMLPADDDSTPRAGGNSSPGPEVLLGAIDNFYPGGPTVYEYVFTVDFLQPSNSTLAGVNGSMPILVPRYDLAFCGSLPNITTYCVPQPGNGELLDTLGDRLMYRLARFDDGVTQHYLVNHSVNDTTAVAARWYEFRAPEGSTHLSLYQSGQTADDGHYRWMGSVAMDQMGDIAIGYSRSSAAAGDRPSIYFAGQTAGDPLGATETEALILHGDGVQIKSFNRWGDYTSMALDGADSCTFWYANEYYPETGAFAWDTWLASLKFPRCP
jgi:hypothetical protein